MLYRLCNICNKKLEYGKKCDCEISRQKKRYKDYANNRTDKEIQKIYSGKRWEKLRSLVSVKQHGLDLYSYYIDDIIEKAETYHHIMEVKEDIGRAYDIDNIIGLTQANHMMIHNIYDKGVEDKRALQELLFGLLNRWKKEME